MEHPETRESASSVYARLESKRQPFIQRAEEVAKLTIPSLFPEQGFSPSIQLETPYNSVGARAVNHLASKLVLALLPPNSPFFRLTIDDRASAQLDGDPKLKATVNEALASIERRVSREIEISAIRPQITFGVKLLEVSGNALIHKPKDSGLRVFSLRNYVVERDPMGNVCVIVLKESISKHAVPTSIRKFIADDKDNPTVTGSDVQSEIINLYTMAKAEDDGSFSIHQEVSGKVIPESVGKYTVDNMPFLPLRWNAISGEDYGRGLGEELLGDLISLEALTKAIVIASAASARVVGLVNPTGFTNPEDLNEAQDNKFVLGVASDVSFLQVQKGGDLSVAMETANSITRRIESSFLLNTSVQRDAERVTAEEFRIMTGELEAALGGTYSILSQELQLPLVRLLMNQLTKQAKITTIPKPIRKFIHPAIITGVEAMGRSSDLGRLQTLTGIIAQVLGPDAIKRRLNEEVFVQTAATAVGVDVKGLFRTEEDVAKIDAAAQAAANAANFTKGASGPAAGGIMDIVKQAMANGQGPAQGQQIPEQLQ